MQTQVAYDGLIQKKKPGKLIDWLSNCGWQMKKNYIGVIPH